MQQDYKLFPDYQSFFYLCPHKTKPKDDMISKI